MVSLCMANAQVNFKGIRQARVKRGEIHSPNSPNSRRSVPSAVQPLISRETFELIQAQLNARAPASAHPRTINSSYLLSGLLRCEPCDRVIKEVPRNLGGTATT